MRKIKITSIKQTIYNDLINEYENKLDVPCTMKLNEIYILDKIEKPSNFCPSAWDTLYPFIEALYKGAEPFPNWMKNKNSAIVSCNDGFRPMSFLIEIIDV